MARSVTPGRFYVAKSVGDAERRLTLGSIALIHETWNDWWKFETLFEVYVINVDGADRIGSTKIGQAGMPASGSAPQLPDSFGKLSSNQFSLGQDVSFYENLVEIFGVRDSAGVLARLNDLAANSKLLDKFENEDVTGESLMRYVSRHTLVRQYSRVINGEEALAGYAFDYSVMKSSSGQWSHETGRALSFAVTPKSLPPTNIHAIIGANGVGKTRMLEQMADVIVVQSADPNHGPMPLHMLSETDESLQSNFSNVVSVAFSAFDPFRKRLVYDNLIRKSTIGEGSKNKSKGVGFDYIGLRDIRPNPKTSGYISRPKSMKMFASEFAESVSRASKIGTDTWKSMMSELGSDSIFQELDVEHLISIEDKKELIDSAKELFKQSSSGHSIVLFTMTRLVELVQERSLVLIDEPEVHLHPPLLAAFVRALSNLLSERNGMAIIATHSPVVAQEVPRSCVWKMRRSGDDVRVTRPSIETFGENVGVLTHELFGLEVQKSGVVRILTEEVSSGKGQDEIIREFGNQLGFEARSILASIYATRSEL